VTFFIVIGGNNFGVSVAEFDRLLFFRESEKDVGVKGSEQGVINHKFKFICLGGNLDIKKISFADSAYATEVYYNGEKIAFKLNKTQIEFDNLLKVRKDGILTILVEK